MLHRHSAADCLRPPLSDTLSPQCQQLKRGYGECRRGLIDMRKRFRGNQPVGLKQLEGAAAAATRQADQPTQAPTDSAATGAGDKKSADNKGYQLYAGKTAFGGAARATSGDEPEPRDWREVENERYRQEQQKKR